MRYAILVAAILATGCSREAATPSPGTTPAPAAIEIVDATYGENCKDFEVAAPAVNSVAAGNATAAVSATCKQGAAQTGSCSYTVDANVIGDPASGCEKDFKVTWTCGTASNTKKVPAEANGKSVDISCS